MRPSCKGNIRDISTASPNGPTTPDPKLIRISLTKQDNSFWKPGGISGREGCRLIQKLSSPDGPGNSPGTRSQKKQLVRTYFIFMKIYNANRRVSLRYVSIKIKKYFGNLILRFTRSLIKKLKFLRQKTKMVE